MTKIIKYRLSVKDGNGKDLCDGDMVRDEFGNVYEAVSYIQGFYEGDALVDINGRFTWCENVDMSKITLINNK